MLSLIKIGRTVYGYMEHGRVEDQEFYVGHIRSEISTRHSKEDIEEVGSMSLKFKGKVQARDKYL